MNIRGKTTSIRDLLLDLVKIDIATQQLILTTDGRGYMRKVIGLSALVRRKAFKINHQINIGNILVWINQIVGDDQFRLFNLYLMISNDRVSN